MSMDFNIDPTDYLGHDNEVFKTKLMELALSEPKKYFEMRRDVLSAVKKQAVTSVYKTYYCLLTNGTTEKGTDSILNGKTSDTYLGDRSQPDEGFKPSVPKQKVNEFALKASKTLDAIAEEAIEMIMPADYRMIAENRPVQKTASQLGFA